MKIGIIFGAFDLIHPGYIKMFEDAKKVCDTLVIGLQTNPRLDRPEKEKPIQTYNERKMILKSIRYIDKILKYTTEKDLIRLLKQVKPDIRVLGTDYKGKYFTGKELGIKIHWHKRNHNWSTTKLKNKIRKK